MQRMQNLLHLVPLAIVALGLSLATAPKSASAQYSAIRADGVREVKAGMKLVLAGNVITPTYAGAGIQDIMTPADYVYRWGGRETPPNATFSLRWDHTEPAVSLSASDGVYAMANRSIQFGLYDPNNDAALVGNPLPYSDYKSIPSGPGSINNAPASLGINTLTASLAPYYLNYGFQVQVRVKAYAHSEANIANFTPTSSATADGGQQVATPGTPLLSVP